MNDMHVSGLVLVMLPVHKNLTKIISTILVPPLSTQEIESDEIIKESEISRGLKQVDATGSDLLLEKKI